MSIPRICIAGFALAVVCSAGGAHVAGETPAATPQAETPELLHYFGVMQPNEAASHEFVIRNEGDAPLELQRPKGSCKCLTMQLKKAVIEPGGEGVLRVQWRAAKEAGESFRQRVQVPTNDPGRETIDFVVSGEVGGHLKIEPARVEWRNANPGEPLTATVGVSSTYWPEVHVSRLSPSAEGLEVELINEAEGEAVSSSRSRGPWLRIRVSEVLARTDFDGEFTMLISPGGASVEPGQAEASNSSKPSAATANDLPVTIHVPVSLELASPLTVSGAGFHPVYNVAYLGIQRPGEEIKRQYLLKVRDKQKSLGLKKLQVKPAEIDAVFEPYRPEKGLYRLVLRLPPDELKRGYVGEESGHVRLEFDHPRIKRLEFALEVSPSH